MDPVNFVWLGIGKLTDAETDKIGWVLYLHNPSLKKIETLDLLYGQYNELTLWISARSERIICLVTNGLSTLPHFPQFTIVSQFLIFKI